MTRHESTPPGTSPMPADACEEDSHPMPSVQGGALGARDPAGLAARGFEFSHEGMAITGADLNVLHANRAFSEITGYALDEIIGKMPGFLDAGAHNEASYQAMWTQLADCGYWQGEIWDRRKNGAIFPAWLTISKVEEDDSFLHFVGNLSDITEKKRAEVRAEYLNLHDALTGLPNKAMFLDRLSWSIASAHRRRQRLGVLALSLDVSQPMSLDSWDTVLKHAASRLQTALRQSDAVARFDDGKLVVLMDDLSSIRHAEWVAKKILWTVRQPFTAVDRESRMDASIGIALFPQHDADATGLLNKAEQAMSAVRRNGKNAFQIYGDPA